MNTMRTPQLLRHQIQYQLIGLEKHHTRYQKGVTLIVSLLMLLIILLSGLSMANLAQMNERSARNEHDHALALLAAEYALADAESDIENSDALTSRSAIFSPRSSQGFLHGCGRGDGSLYQGLCLGEEGVVKPIWLTENIADTSANSPSVQLGRFTGRTIPVGKGSLPGQLPRYIIELVADTTPGQAADAQYIYRITAIGFGVSETAQAVVQSFYRKSLR